MEYKKLEREVQNTVKRLADDKFEDILCHPKDYAEHFNSSDKDLCWEEAIEYAKEDVIDDPKNWIDEDFQEKMSNKDWSLVDDIVRKITWITYIKQEIDTAFAQGV